MEPTHGVAVAAMEATNVIGYFAEVAVGEPVEGWKAMAVERSIKD